MHEKSLGWWVLKPDHQEGFLVQITVSLTVDLPATADVNTAEPLILDAGRQAMRQALHLAALRAQAHVAAVRGVSTRPSTPMAPPAASCSPVSAGSRCRCCASAAPPVAIAFERRPPSLPPLMGRTSPPNSDGRRHRLGLRDPLPARRRRSSARPAPRSARKRCASRRSATARSSPSSTRRRPSACSIRRRRPFVLSGRLPWPRR